MTDQKQGETSPRDLPKPDESRGRRFNWERDDIEVVSGGDAEGAEGEETSSPK